MAAWLALMVASTCWPVAPPPAAAMAWAASFGGIFDGSGKAASLVNSAGLAWITFSSGANFCALASCTLSFWASATMSACSVAKASWLLYWVA